MVNYITLLKGGGSCTKYFKSLFPFSLTYIETTQKQAEENLRLVAGIASATATFKAPFITSFSTTRMNYFYNTDVLTIYEQICFCVALSLLSCVWLFATPCSKGYVARHAALSVGFSRQESWSGLHALLQGIFPTQGSNPGLPRCRWIFYPLSHQRSPLTNLGKGKKVGSENVMGKHWWGSGSKAGLAAEPSGPSAPPPSSHSWGLCINPRPRLPGETKQLWLGLEWACLLVKIAPGLTKLRFSVCRESSVRDKVIGKKWIY